MGGGVQGIFSSGGTPSSSSTTGDARQYADVIVVEEGEVLDEDPTLGRGVPQDPLGAERLWRTPLTPLAPSAELLAIVKEEMNVFWEKQKSEATIASPASPMAPSGPITPAAAAAASTPPPSRGRGGKPAPHTQRSSAAHNGGGRHPQQQGKNNKRKRANDDG